MEYRPPAPVPLPSLGTFLQYVTGKLVSVLQSERRYQIQYSIVLGSSLDCAITVTKDFWLRWFDLEELTTMLAVAGFRVVGLNGDFSASPVTDHSCEVVVSARLSDPATYETTPLCR